MRLLSLSLIRLKSSISIGSWESEFRIDANLVKTLTERRKEKVRKQLNQLLRS